MRAVPRQKADALRGILDYLAPRFKGPVVIAESSAGETWQGYENFKYTKLVEEYTFKDVQLTRLHTDDASWQGNTPNLRIALDALPGDRTFTPQGWIAAKWATSDTGRRRRYYRITKDGRTQLAAQRKQWQVVDDTLRCIWAKSCTA